jgi:predicted nucleic acid-binding protein
VIYLDATYLARLYLDDPGFEAVRELARRDAVACCVHGQAEVIAAIHRKHREGVFTATQYRHVLEQFDLDSGQNAFRWLPLSPAMTARVTSVCESLPPAFFLRAADALHLACAAENRFREIHSNDQRLLAAAGQFGLKAVNVI